MLLAVARSRVVRDQIGRVLSQDFSARYAQSLATAGAALAEKQLGDFTPSVTIDAVKNSTLVVGGQGLYLPIHASGTASLRFNPAKARS